MTWLAELQEQWVSVRGLDDVVPDQDDRNWAGRMTAWYF